MDKAYRPHVEKAIGRPLPTQLVQFCTELGSIYGEIGERKVTVFFPSIEYILQELDIDSLGIIDMIRHSWGNDRSEFSPEEGLPHNEMATLDNNYTCFACFRDGSHEECSYLYFDQQGSFGVANYH